MLSLFTPSIRSTPRGWKALDITSQIISDFRSTYKVYASTDDYPDSSLIPMLQEADIETGSLWGPYYSKRFPITLKRRGMFAYAAHTLAIQNAQDNAGASGGASASGLVFPVTDEEVGDERTSYGVPEITTEDQANNGTFNLTPYGIEFLRLRQRATAGAWMV